MPKNNVTKFINNHFVDVQARSCFTKDGFNHFKTYFGNVKRGQPKIWTAPFAGKTPIATVMNDWSRVLVSIRDKWPSLWEFELDLAKKVGPLSVQLPLSERLPDIASYYESIHLDSTALNPSAMKAVIAEFSQVRGLRLRNQHLTVDKMKKSSNSGTPFWTKRRNVIGDSLPASSIVYQGRHPDVYSTTPKWNGKTPAVVGWRGQEGGPTEEDVKQRVVWMFPFSVNINELQVYQPLIESCQRFNLVPAWVSMDAVDKEVTLLFDTKSSDDPVVCTDFDKFDQHFNPDMQSAAETILSGILSHGQQELTWLKDVFPIKYYIPIVWEILHDRQPGDEGVSLFEGRHGMASGSGGTNCDETLVHRALQYEAAIRMGTRLNTHSMCLGDDGILTYPGIRVEDVVETYKAHGQEMNLTKQHVSTQDCIYLRRWHHQDYREKEVCVGVYSTMRAIGRLRYLERFMDPEVWSEKMVALRQLSILENCNHHPLREQFAQFCMKRDKYRLGIDIPGFLANIESEAKEAIDYMPDFLGYTKTLQGKAAEGISEWWIVKYLKSL
nr:MAG: RNA-dependent RNA-polymerase [Picobirnavirus sp.]